MFAKKHRLPKFITFGSAETVFSKAFLLKSQDNNEEISRFGVVVSKKIEKTAVGRNKIKRQVRNFIQEFLAEIEKGKDILIIAKKESRGKNKSEIFSFLNDVFRKKNLIK